MVRCPPCASLPLGSLVLAAFGRSVARRAVPFGLRILVADPYVAPADTAAAGVELVSLDELASQSDIITLHCPLTPETRHLVGSDFLDKVKPTAVLVNTARGGIVDMEAVAAALQDGRLAAAGLDVVEPVAASRQPHRSIRYRMSFLPPTMPIIRNDLACRCASIR